MFFLCQIDRVFLFIDDEVEFFFEVVDGVLFVYVVVFDLVDEVLYVGVVDEFHEFFLFGVVFVC